MPNLSLANLYSVWEQRSLSLTIGQNVSYGKVEEYTKGHLADDVIYRDEPSHCLDR